MISPVGFAIYLGTFSCPAWLSHITGSRPNQADSKGTLALFTPTQEIALAPEPLLTFTCPKTKDRTPTRVEADARTLRASWKSKLLVKCPSCGGVHEISVRDAYLNGAVDVVGRPERQRVSAKGSPDSHRVRSSSASRFTAAQAGFFVLSQLSERPER